MNAIIQAGGRSSRMREDKSWLLINELPMIEYTLAVAQSVAEETSIVVHPASLHLARYEELAARWKANLIFDLHDYRGPLGGIETALQQGKKEESMWMLACDLPFVSAEFLKFLQQIHVAERNELTVPLDQQGRPQMLAAVYATACSSAITALLAANELKAQLLQTRVRTRRVNWQEYSHLAEAEQLLTNINTPEDWQLYHKK